MQLVSPYHLESSCSSSNPIRVCCAPLTVVPCFAHTNELRYHPIPSKKQHNWGSLKFLGRV